MWCLKKQLKHQESIAIRSLWVKKEINMNEETVVLFQVDQCMCLKAEARIYKKARRFDIPKFFKLVFILISLLYYIKVPYRIKYIHSYIEAKLQFYFPEKQGSTVVINSCYF